MTYTVASHQGEIEMFWPHISGLAQHTCLTSEFEFFSYLMKFASLIIIFAVYYSNAELKQPVLCKAWLEPQFNLSLCLFYTICVFTLLLMMCFVHKMPSDVPHLICPALLCHLHRVLWSLPSSMFLSFSTEDCVCWNYVVWVFMAFAVSQALSVSFSPRVVYCVCVCVCVYVLHWRTDLADSTFSLIYTQCTHMCAHTAVSGYSASHTHNADLLFEMPPDTEISTSTASNAWPHLKIGMQSSSQQKYKDAGKKSEQKRENERKTERERKDSKNWKQEQ